MTCTGQQSLDNAFRMQVFSSPRYRRNRIAEKVNLNFRFTVLMRCRKDNKKDVKKCAVFVTEERILRGELEKKVMTRYN